MTGVETDAPSRSRGSLRATVRPPGHGIGVRRGDGPFGTAGALASGATRVGCQEQQPE